MTKLTLTQQDVMAKAKTEIDTARKYDDFDDYFKGELTRYYNEAFNTPDKMKARDLQWYEISKQHWEEHLKGIVLTTGQGSTIRRLEALGLIEVVKDSTGTGKFGYDTIRILNY